MTFQDYTFETLGTRQKRWLDYLAYHNDLQPLKVAEEYAPKKYSKWTDSQMCICPVDHREILSYETVVEFDDDNRKNNLILIQVLMDKLKKKQVQYYMQDHNGRSPHLHIFNTPPQVARTILSMGKVHNLDKLKYAGSGLCREIGGLYRKDNGDYYASCFQDIMDIKPITDKKEVMFPWLDLDG